MSTETETARHEAAGARLARLRRERGLTQKDLATRLGVSLWTVDELEAGRRDFDPHHPAIAGLTDRPQDLVQERVEPAAPAASPAPAAGGARTLVLTALTLIVVIRFFTEVLGVAPRFLNFIDVPLLAVLVLAAAAHPADAAVRREAARYLPAALLFLGLCALATIANPWRVEPGPVLVFIYGFLAPLLVYWSAYRLWPAGAALSLSRLLVTLGLIQLAVVVLIDVPRFLARDNPDEISGTFGENPYQLVFFLLVFAAVLAGIFTYERQRPIARFAPLILAAVLGVVLLAQYRALLITTALTILLLTAVLGSARIRGLVAGLVAALAFVSVLSYTAQAFPILKLPVTIETLRSNPTSYVSSRADALSHVTRLYADDPLYVVTGTGPGTYSSRGWQTFSQIDSTSESNVQGEYAGALTGGRAYETDVSNRYVSPQLASGEAIQGSKALSSPYSSYGALLAEVGLLGFLVMTGVYILALVRAVRMSLAMRLGARAGDPLPALVFGSATALLVLFQMGFLENWLEVTRVTFPTWILLAVATREFRARYGRVAR